MFWDHHACCCLNKSDVQGLPRRLFSPLKPRIFVSWVQEYALDTLHALLVGTYAFSDHKANKVVSEKFEAICSDVGLTQPLQIAPLLRLP